MHGLVAGLLMLSGPFKVSIMLRLAATTSAALSCSSPLLHMLNAGSLRPCGKRWMGWQLQGVR